MYRVELTDTFGGEANYSWARRAKVPAPEYDTVQPKGYQRTIMRRAKAAVGLTGMAGRTERVGCGYEFRPYGACMVMFVDWEA